jgi:hypothetical protein
VAAVRAWFEQVCLLEPRVCERGVERDRFVEARQRGARALHALEVDAFGQEQVWRPDQGERLVE